MSGKCWGALWAACLASVWLWAGPVEARGPGKKGSTRKAKKRRKPPSGFALLGKATILGGLGPARYRRARKRFHKQLLGCYRKRLRKKPRMVGSMVLRMLVFAPWGKLETMQIKRDTTKDRLLLLCIRRKARHWRFPRSKCGRCYMIIKQPLSFVLQKDVRKILLGPKGSRRPAP